MAAHPSGARSLFLEFLVQQEGLFKKKYGKLHFNIGTIQLEYHIIPRGRKKLILIHFVRAYLESYTRIVARINQE